MRSDFDACQDSYEDEVQRSIDLAGQDHAFFTEVKARGLVDLVRRRVGDPGRLGALDRRHYDSYIVRAKADPAPPLFPGAGRQLALAAREGNWWLFLRRPPIGGLP